MGLEGGIDRPRGCRLPAGGKAVSPGGSFESSNRNFVPLVGFSFGLGMKSQTQGVGSSHLSNGSQD